MASKGIDFAAIPQTAIKVITSPSAFFREMPKTGGFVEPLVFAVVMGAISGLIQSILAILKLNVASGMAMGAASVVIIPIITAVFSFIGAAVLFVIWKLMGSLETYETAYRCGAYISAVAPILAVLSLIPYIGTAVGIVIYTFLLVIASVEAHRILSQKAWLVFGIIGAIFILLSVSGEFAARKLSKEWGGRAQEMEESARKMQEEMSKIPQTGQMTEEQKQQIENAAKEMEEMMKNMPQQPEEEKGE